MKKIIIIVTIAALLAFQAGCAASVQGDLMKQVEAAAWPETADGLSDEFSRSIQDFSWALFKAAMSEQGNFALSAPSVYFALGMLLNGTAGDTRTAIVQTLMADNLTVEDINLNIRNWMIRTGQNEEIDIAIENSIWIRDGFEVEPAFLKANADFYGAAARQLDFSKVETLDEINRWVKEATHGLIDRVIENINPGDVMYLLNAIYFKGDWQRQFDPKQTIDEGFLSPDGWVSAPMMHLTARMTWIGNNACDGVILPYSDGRFAMVLMLPEAGMSPRDLAESMTPEQFTALLATRYESEGFLAVPRFEIESTSPLKPALEALGMSPAFSDSADFSKISRQQGLAVTGISQKTVIIVDERGSEAAAVTSVTIAGSRQALTRPELKLDRPFLFAIVDLETSIPLFLGILDDPTQ